MKSKGTAAVLAILLGGIGTHKFYLGRSGAGLTYLMFCWTGIPALLGLIDFFYILGMSQAQFDTLYNDAREFATTQGFSPDAVVPAREVTKRNRTEFICQACGKMIVWKDKGDVIWNSDWAGCCGMGVAPKFLSVCPNCKVRLKFKALRAEPPLAHLQNEPPEGDPF